MRPDPMRSDAEKKETSPVTQAAAEADEVAAALRARKTGLRASTLKAARGAPRR